ncbi:MAG: PIN domain-containing protein [Phycisphaerales bacterium]
MNAVDTNILAYSLDAHDDTKRRKALELLTTLPVESTVIPWQVACEIGAVLNTMARDGRFRGDYRLAITSVRTRFRVALPTIAVLDRALQIQTTAGVSHWDALLISACAEAGVTKLYTEDMQSRPTIEGVGIVNPFA